MASFFSLADLLKYRPRCQYPHERSAKRFSPDLLPTNARQQKTLPTVEANGDDVDVFAQVSLSDETVAVNSMKVGDKD